MDEPPDAALLRRFEQARRSVDHDPPELLLLALSDSDEVDHPVDARHRPPEALGVRHVALDELAAQGFEPGRRGGVADETADGEIAAAQLVDDVTAHEAGAPRDEDHPAGSRWKFCQYRDGVGPRWSWYLEPISPVP